MSLSPERFALKAGLIAVAIFLTTTPAPAAALLSLVRVEPCLSRFPSPGMAGGTLDCVPAGTRVERLRDVEGWTLVKAPDGSVGWGIERFLAPLDVKGPEPAAASVVARPCLVRRPSPGPQGNRLDCIRYGTRVRRLRETGGWTLARTAAGDVGWVASRYLTEGTVPETVAHVRASRLLTTPARLKPRVSIRPRNRLSPGRSLYPTGRVVTEPCLRRRAVADAGAASMDCLPHGTKVELIGRLADWTQVRSADGRLGWVAGDQLNPRFGSPLLLTDGDVDHVDPARGPDAEALVENFTEEQEERGLEVGKWATSDENPEGLMIVGMLRNMGSRVSTAVTLTVQVFDWEEDVILEQPAIVDTTVLMPGQGTRFQVTLPGVFAFRALKFDTSSVDFEVTDEELVSRR